MIIELLMVGGHPKWNFKSVQEKIEKNAEEEGRGGEGYELKDDM